MKRAIALLLVLCMAFSLAACGKKKKAKDGGEETPAPPTPVPNEAFEVKLNLKAKLSPAAFADKSAVIRFEFEDGTVQNVKMTQARSNGDGTYTFTCKIDPIKMSDNVRAQILYSDGVRGTVLDYSLRTYFQNVLRKTNLDPKMANLIKALVNYGGYLQKFNGEPEEKLINNLINMPLDNEVVTIGDEYKAVIANNGTTVRAKSANISISSLISLNVKFTLAEGASVSDYRFTVNGQTVKAIKDGDVYVVSCKGIAPTDFDEMNVVRAESVSDPADCAEVQYGVYTYAKRMLETSTNNDLKNLLKAIVKYGEAAAAYEE